MADWNLPTLTTLYADVLAELKGRDETALKMDGGGTNLPTGAMKFNAATGQFDKYDGTAWSQVTNYAKTDAANTFTAYPQRLKSDVNNVGYLVGVRQDSTPQYLLGATSSTVPLDLRAYDIDGSTVIGKVYITSVGNIGISPKSGSGNVYIYSDLFVYPNSGSIRINNSAGRASYLFGRATDGVSDGWYVGRGSTTTDELSLNNYVAGANLYLNTNGGKVYANNNEIYHTGNDNYILGNFTGSSSNNAIDIVIKRLTDYEMYDVKISGYDYGNNEPLETEIGFYDYTSSTVPNILKSFIVTSSNSLNKCRIYKNTNGDFVVRLEFSYQYFQGVKVSVYRTRYTKTDRETTQDQIIFDRALEATRNYEVAPAIQTNSTPIGGIVAFSGSTIPLGYIECAGQLISRTTYARLFSVIGTRYGDGDGSTTFKLPDLRGEFIRGYDNGRGVDSGRALGSFQSSSLGSHTHYLNNYTWAIGSNGDGGDGNGGTSYYVKIGTNSGVTQATGGTETRPRNVAMIFAIKY